MKKKILSALGFSVGFSLLVGCGGSDTCCKTSATVAKNYSVDLVERGDKNRPIKNNGDNNKTIKPIEPIAIITANKKEDFNITICHGKVIHFDGTKSVDKDGDVKNLIYKWELSGGNILSLKKAFDYQFNKSGTYEVVLSVTDEQNLTSYDSIFVRVR